jgi:hypothetical protein
MVVLLLLLSFSTFADDLLSAHIAKNNPKLDKVYINRLAKAIKVSSNRHGIDAKIYSAMLMQESGYRMGVHNCYKIPADSKALKLNHCEDFSISMINRKTIEAYGFNKQRLITSLEYAVDCGAIVLKDLKKRYGHDSDYWVRYNVGTRPKHKIPTIWNDYKVAVLRWL